MVRSLWSAATGMNAQQTNVDTIANNLSNVNTVGYKSQVAQFKSLLYQNLQTETTTANGEPKPTSSQVGLGVRTSSINNLFSQGALLESQSTSAMAIDGAGFFGIQNNDGELVYTRNGDFVWALGATGDMMLTNSDGQPVLSTIGQPIIITGSANALISSQIIIDSWGQIMYPDATGAPQPLGFRIGLWQFNNVGGLERLGNSVFAPTEASGPALNEATNANLRNSAIRQGYLEGSNVYVADEMVNLIVAQRAYELNSKAITTSDEMLQTANNIKR
ncbi:MAG: flagellar hook-basal body protein [Lachnospiraceae bacterium]|nr:flagellar hook-basal body protein [Lachnospiraceae bacterium]